MTVTRGCEFSLVVYQHDSKVNTPQFNIHIYTKYVIFFNGQKTVSQGFSGAKVIYTVHAVIIARTVSVDLF